MSAAVDRLMEEARRRFESFGVRYGKSLPEAWIGLGMPSEYRPAVDAGLMRPTNRPAMPRVAAWYVLTDAGLAAYRAAFPGSEDGSRRVYRDGSPTRPYSVGDAAARERIEPLVAWILSRGERGFAVTGPDGPKARRASCHLESAPVPVDGFEGQFRVDHFADLSDGSSVRLSDLPDGLLGEGSVITFLFADSPVGASMSIDDVWDVRLPADGGCEFEAAGLRHVLSAARA